jgi:hypothetical protein
MYTLSLSRVEEPQPFFFILWYSSFCDLIMLALGRLVSRKQAELMYHVSTYSIVSALNPVVMLLAWSTTLITQPRHTGISYP